MNSSELRKKFLDFLKENGHTIVPSSSLMPTDPSVLFTTAGMQQFKPYYLESESPYGKNTASSQKCFRTSDIEEVGDDKHLTFFEMLGNFSFGGYFKKESIRLAYDFVVEEMGFEIDYVTIFDPAKVSKEDWRSGVPKDQESYDIWKNEIKIPEDKIKGEGIDNFWGPTGDEGPCGPTTEIYVKNIEGESLELWNIVFNEFFCDASKKLKKLLPPGIDTGMGLERLAMVSQKKPSIFETDLFLPVIKEIERLSGQQYESNKRIFRIITDHIKSSVFLIADGFFPSNIEQGYILRRILRRAIRFGKTLELPQNFFAPLVNKITSVYTDVYPELKFKETDILTVIQQEEEKFEKTLERGLKEFEKIEGAVSAQDAFNLYQSYGFPIEITQELAKEKGLEVDAEGFKKELEKHQELSRTASAGMFKSGLADHSEQTIKYHTAAHLMLAGLRKVLGEDVYQKGSNITAERLRFDFSCKEKMTKDQIKKVEGFVNDAIGKDLPVRYEEVSLAIAKERGAMGVFETKYGETVKVYTIGEGDDIVSKEICGGPHVERTGVLGKFKIQKEESSSAGVRRIKAILE